MRILLFKALQTIPQSPDIFTLDQTLSRLILPVVLSFQDPLSGIQLKTKLRNFGVSCISLQHTVVQFSPANEE
jgi:hypothetical protein